MKKKLLFMVMLLCMLGLVVQAEVVLTTADGEGADTYLSNDGQNEGTGPDVNHGTEDSIVGFRQLVDARSRTGYIRFDLSLFDGSVNDAILSMDADYLKGGAKTVTVYGVIDGEGDYWGEDTVTYNNAAGLIPNPPTTLGNAAIDEAEAELVGLLGWPGVPDPAVYPVAATSNTIDLDLASFLAKDTNGLVTLIFIGDNNEGSAAAKENTAGYSAPTLTLPDANDLVDRATNPMPAPYDSVSASATTQVSWTTPDPNNPGETVTCDIYFGTTEPNVFLPNYGLPLLEADVTDSTADLPVLTGYTTYYWCVNIKDSSFPGQTLLGKVWVFDTDNVAPIADAGPDQYVWLTKAVVDTGSSNDTYMRDNTDRGGLEFLDIRSGGSDWGFGGYLQFDLSALTAMGPGTLENATLTLSKVPASRDDGISNGRFALQGLDNGTTSTPQNWDEHLLNTDTVGDEWSHGVFPLPLSGTGFTLTDLDDDVAGITENVGDTITVSGTALDAFLQGRVDDTGLVTFIITNEDGSDRGYGVASKENSNEALRPNLTLTFVPDSASNNGDASVDLDGTVTDDGLPDPPAAYTVLWEQISGPETVSIDPNNLEDVTVTIGTAGTYEFQLTADDSDLTDSDIVQIYVGTTPCDAAQNVPGYETNIADLNTDCFVDLKDFAVLAVEWLDCNSLECP